MTANLSLPRESNRSYKRHDLNTLNTSTCTAETIKGFFHIPTCFEIITWLRASKNKQPRTRHCFFPPWHLVRFPPRGEHCHVPANQNLGKRPSNSFKFQSTCEPSKTWERPAKLLGNLTAGFIKCCFVDEKNETVAGHKRQDSNVPIPGTTDDGLGSPWLRLTLQVYEDCHGEEVCIPPPPRKSSKVVSICKDRLTIPINLRLRLLASFVNRIGSPTA